MGDADAFLLVASHVDEVEAMGYEDALARRVPEVALQACAFFRVWCALHAARAIPLVYEPWPPCFTLLPCSLPPGAMVYPRRALQVRGGAGGGGAFPQASGDAGGQGERGEVETMGE